jgi:hypothetical protein
MPMKKVKVKKWWSKWAYGWNFMGYLLARGDFLKAVNLQKFHSFLSTQIVEMVVFNGSCVQLYSYLLQILEKITVQIF